MIDSSKPKLLDLFCGIGGWSVGFHRVGFECVGLDIRDVGYPYEFWKYDIRDFACDSNMGFDVVVASPPCNEFTSLRLANKKTPPKPEKGKELVKEAKRVIDSIHPRYWIVENVNGAMKHIYPILGTPAMKHHPYYFWGNFPRFMVAQSNRLEKGALLNGDKMRGPWLDRPDRHNPVNSWLRARLPLPISMPLAAACKEALETGRRLRSC